MKLEQINHIGIIGTGMMASSIDVLTTGHGYKTTVLVRSEESKRRCKQEYDNFYGDLIRQGLVTADQAAICARYLHFTESYDDLADADVIFECVLENKEIKHAVYAEIEAHCPAIKAVCSVSSAILVDELVEKATIYKDRILVTHPFNPPHLVPMFELSGGASTAPEVKQFVKDFLESMGRVVVMVKKPAPGFIATRLQEALWRECLYIVENGYADPEDVDKAAKFSFMPRYTSIGMFEHFDCGGMKLSSSVNNYLFPYLSDAKKNPKIMDDMIARGDLGQKAGKGFYDWTNVDMDAYRARVSAPYWRFFDWDLPKE